LNNEWHTADMHISGPWGSAEFHVMVG